MDNRTKILQTAEKLFAQQGFDGARVDEIAKQAGVNKALIYYYFDNKDAILEEILHAHMESFFQEREEMDISSEDLSKKEIIDLLIDMGMKMYENMDDFLRIAYTEELKSVKKHWPLFHLMEESWETGMGQLKRFGLKVKDRKKLRFMSFFFGTVPLSMFVMLREEWADHFKTDEESLQRMFIEGFKKTYVRYLLEDLVE